MIKFNDSGNITLATLEIEPANKFEAEQLKKFAQLNTKQRAELITIGFETLARKYQRNADKVLG